MTKAELLKLLEPFPDDALIVVDTGYAEIEGWQKEYETLMNEQQQALGDLERRFMS